MGGFDEFRARLTACNHSEARKLFYFKTFTSAITEFHEKLLLVSQPPDEATEACRVQGAPQHIRMKGLYHLSVEAEGVLYCSQKLKSRLFCILLKARSSELWPPAGSVQAEVCWPLCSWVNWSVIKKQKRRVEYWSRRSELKFGHLGWKFT